MKKFFIGVFALALSSLAFLSCDDEGKIDNETENGKAARGTFLTVPQQQQTIKETFEGVADAIQFTEFTNALNVVSGIIGREISSKELVSILSSPEILTDSLFQVKISSFMTMMTRDTVILDLAPFYMTADLFITDTVMIDTIQYADENGGRATRIDTTNRSILTLANIKHDVNYLQINVFVDNHEIKLKADFKAGESIVTVKDDKGVKSIILPQSAHLSIIVDGNILAELNGQYQSDFAIYVEDIKGEDDIIKVVEGSKMSVSSNLSVANYLFTGGLKYDEDKGIEGKMDIKYGDNYILSANANLDAVFEGLNIEDTTAVLVWAQNPELLKSISLDASLAGGKVEFKGNVTNPFKDEELATTLRSLMVPGVTISQDKAKQTVGKLNTIISAGFYFEGYKDAQAKFKLIYKEPKAEPDSIGKVSADKDGESPLDAIMELFGKTGAYPVLIAHDEEGNEIEVEFEEYFGKIDFKTFIQTVSGKFMQTFGPIMEK